MILYYPLWKKITVIAIALTGILFVSPNFLKNGTIPVPVLNKLQKINLGLDLQGGAHLLLQVKIENVIEDYMLNLSETVRQGLKKQRIVASAPEIKDDALIIRLRDPENNESLRKIIQRSYPDLIIDSNRQGEFRISLTEPTLRTLQSEAISRSIEVIRRRIDETGTREPLIQRQGANRIVVQLPGAKDPEALKTLIGKTAKLSFHLTNDNADPLSNIVPIGYRKLPSGKKDALGNPLEYHIVTTRALVSGENLRDSSATFDQNNQPAVEFTFDAAGGFKFGNITSKNVGRSLAIILDDEVISAPRIQSAIIGGSGIITGNFSVAEANQLAILLRAGALPAGLEIIEERTVGPGLGSDSVEAGKIAFTIGLIAVALFMFAVYGVFGIFANLSLAINIILIFGVISFLQATLTLPGIAGIILTIGMAVDANILIFERIREEYRNGRKSLDAIDSGFSRAFSTILDANITTLIAAFLLFILGVGPIKGFAVTLSIGVFTSVFCAVMLSRYFVSSWAMRPKNIDKLPLV